MHRRLLAAVTAPHARRHIPPGREPGGDAVVNGTDQGRGDRFGPRKNDEDDMGRGLLWPGLLSISPPSVPGRDPTSRRRVKEKPVQVPGAPRLFRVPALNGVSPRDAEKPLGGNP
ncbi:hypothetical protein GCM10010430_58660 [Kitasatospora cystarginea]|uniref:Uncharacterized protein n=1 Tax=Kitasatospora cystarginea TaxID=58350 RepID=A0ABP5RLG6_9ACTN